MKTTSKLLILFLLMNCNNSSDNHNVWDVRRDGTSEQKETYRVFNKTRFPNLDKYLDSTKNYLDPDFKKLLDEDKYPNPEKMHSIALESKLRMKIAMNKFYNTNDIFQGQKALAYGEEVAITSPNTYGATTILQMHEICNRIDSLRTSSKITP